jgi:hypothetical protein
MNFEIYIFYLKYVFMWYLIKYKEQQFMNTFIIRFLPSNVILDKKCMLFSAVSHHDSAV